MTWDLAIVETQNGGDLVQLGSDLAVVNSIENMPYLAMFGGNTEAVTTTDPQIQSFDWWGNSMLPNQPSIQLNSITEKTINSVALTSASRVQIENAIKTDLKFLSDQGVSVTVNVEIVSTDRISVSLRLLLPDNGERIIIIDFRKTSDGDFSIFDFNDDFLV